MNYKLAKQLKDAGFPIQNGVDGPQWLKNGDEEIYTPTLEELIEACGKEIQLVAQKEKCWKAVSFLKISSTRHLSRDGLTPTEAVAMLYLALYGNKQNNKNTGETPRLERR